MNQMVNIKEPELLAIKYRQHGLLTKNTNHKTIHECWTFETSRLANEYEGCDLITLLDDLSSEGYELVTGHDGEYILRTKEELEHEQEYHIEEDDDAKRADEGDILMRTDDLPEILTAKHIAKYLGLSLRRVYELFQTNPKAGGIQNFNIGASKRVEKRDFFDWIDTRKQVKDK